METNKVTRNCPCCGKLQIFKNQKSLNKAIKLGRLCKSCGKLGAKHWRFVPRPLEGYIRNCPVCNKIMHYTDKSHLDRAIRENCSCRSCAGKAKLITDKMLLNLKAICWKNRNVPSPRLGAILSDETKAKIGKGNKGKRKGKLKFINELSMLKAEKQRVEFYHWLKGNNNGFELYTGMDLTTFKNWIASQFEDGMTWENWGVHTWHIDHIKFLHLYNLSNEEDCKNAWNYMNLRPLWASDNLRRTTKDKHDSTLVFIVDSFEKLNKTIKNGEFIVN